MINRIILVLQSEVVEFNVGVSHLALDEERERYTRIRERIESIIIALEKNVSVALNIQISKQFRIPISEVPCCAIRTRKRP